MAQAASWPREFVLTANTVVATRNGDVPYFSH
jgi:hypothetical protein